MRFSKQESAAIVAAADEAARELGLRDAGDLLAGQAKLQKHPVWKDLAEQFPKRTALSLYSHVKRQCHPGAHKGKWSDDETSQLRALFEQQGPNWSEIAAEIGRTPEACRDRFRAVCGEATEAISHDKWTPSETCTFTSSKVNGIPILDIDDPADISFVRVARRVKTRNKQQCARMWYKLRGLAHAGKVLEDTAHQLDLCEKIRACGADTVDDVPWSKLGYDNLGCSTNFARDCFAKLARPYGTLPFPAIVERLIDHLQLQVQASTLEEWEADDRKRKRQAETTVR